MLQFTGNNNLQTKTAASLLYPVLICALGTLHQSNICCLALLWFPLNCGITSHCSRWSGVQWYKNLNRKEIFSTLKDSEQDHLGISHTICSVDSSKVLL